MKCSNCGHVNETRKKNAIYLSEAEFSQWWFLYPRKTSKFLCSKIWKKIEQQPGLFEKIIASLMLQRKTDQWQKGIIPNPSTWLHQRRWDDEIQSTGEIMRTSQPSNPEAEERMKQAADKAQAMMEIEWAKRQAMKNAAIRDEARTSRMQDAWGDN